MSTKEVLQLTGAINVEPRADVMTRSGQRLKAWWSDDFQITLVQHPALQNSGPGGFLVTASPAQWLLIGGPGHGKTLWIKAGTTVVYHDAEGVAYLYSGREYVHAGNIYRIGTHKATEQQMAEITDLIHSTQLAHLRSEHRDF